MTTRQIVVLLLGAAAVFALSFLSLVWSAEAHDPNGTWFFEPDPELVGPGRVGESARWTIEDDYYAFDEIDNDDDGEIDEPDEAERCALVPGLYDLRVAYVSHAEVGPKSDAAQIDLPEPPLELGMAAAVGGVAGLVGLRRYRARRRR